MPLMNGTFLRDLRFPPELTLRAKRPAANDDDWARRAGTPRAAIGEEVIRVAYSAAVLTLAEGALVVGHPFRFG